MAEQLNEAPVEEAAPETVEAAPAEPPKQEAAPKQDEKTAKQPRAKRSDIAELQAKKDREVAAANKAANEARSEAQATRAELDEVRGLLNAIRSQGVLSDDDEEKVKNLSNWQRTLSERESRVLEYERRLTIDRLEAQYGIPAEDLADYDNPRDMELAAAKYALALRQEEPSELPETPDPRAEEKGSEQDQEDDTPDEPSQPPPFDLGVPSSLRKSYKDMSPSEFEAEKKRMAERARSQMLRQRR